MAVAVNFESYSRAAKEALVSTLKERLEGLRANPRTDPVVVGRLQMLVKHYEQSLARSAKFKKTVKRSVSSATAVAP